MSTDALSYLRCPVCRAELAVSGAALRCAAGHAFDMARQGYVNLLTGRSPHPGDSPAMVAARARFLAAGHYRFLAEAIAAVARRHVTAAVRRHVTAAVARRKVVAATPDPPPPRPTATARREATPGPSGPDGPAPRPELAVDVGGGTGYHLAAVLDARPALAGLVLDVSKAAARRAARAHPRALAAVCDAWSRLPLADGAALLVLSVFAPRNGPEFHRVLRADGALVVATPTADHLAELVSRLDLLRVDPAKRDRVEAALGEKFTAIEEGVHESGLRLTRADVTALVGMGPSAWHTDPAGLARRVAALAEPVAVTASVRVTTYRPR